MTTDEDFALRLEQAYREPVAGLDRAAIARAALGAVEAADRRRWTVLAAAAAVGAGISGAGVLTLGMARPLASAADHAAAALYLVATAVAQLPSAWACGLVGLALAASTVYRSFEDS